MKQNKRIVWIVLSFFVWEFIVFFYHVSYYVEWIIQFHSIGNNDNRCVCTCGIYIYFHAVLYNKGGDRIGRGLRVRIWVCWDQNCKRHRNKWMPWWHLDWPMSWHPRSIWWWKRHWCKAVKIAMAVERTCFPENWLMSTLWNCVTPSYVAMLPCYDKSYSVIVTKYNDALPTISRPPTRTTSKIVLDLPINIR